MAKKEDLNPSSPQDVGHTFDRENYVLNFKPKIEYEEPLQEIEDLNPTTIDNVGELEDLRNRTQNLIDGYAAVTKLADIAQARIDEKVYKDGGLDIQLDTLKDATVISAIKRCYPKVTDPNKITFEMYKTCLAKLAAQGAAKNVSVSDADINAAKNDPLRTSFGGLKNIPGTNRPELSPNNTIDPVDLNAFQIAGVLALFKMMYPLIKYEDKKEIKEHEMTKKHT